MTEQYQVVENNEYFILIYKKPGTSFHSDDGSTGLFETVKKTEKLSELYPVHRLDKVTSGLLLMAKTAVVNQELVNQFKERKIEKFYLAISAKKPKKKQGLIKGDMAAARRGAWKLKQTIVNPAITQFFSSGLGDGKRLFIIKPHTGRTHQIRVALKSVGAPILGDSLYADSATSGELDRVYLHSYSLAFSIQNTFYRFTELPREGTYFLDDAFKLSMQEYLAPWEKDWPILKSG